MTRTRVRLTARARDKRLAAGATAREENQAIREAVAAAVSIERRSGPFTLSGRGHEPRITLDRSLAAILRGLEIPAVQLSGYGPNRYYPARVFRTAHAILRTRFRRPPLDVRDARVGRMVRPARRARTRPRRSSRGVLCLPDGSRVRFHARSFRFACVSDPQVGDTASLERRRAPFPFDSRRLAECLEHPTLPFGECFRSTGHGSYSPRRSLHDFDATFITRMFRFPGSYRGGTFCASLTEWRFLDGGIRSQLGYGSAGSWTVVWGAEALRVICLLHGIEQPRTLPGEVQRRPLALLLEELSRAPLQRSQAFGLPSAEGASGSVTTTARGDQPLVLDPVP